VDHGAELYHRTYVNRGDGAPPSTRRPCLLEGLCRKVLHMTKSASVIGVPVEYETPVFRARQRMVNLRAKTAPNEKDRLRIRADACPLCAVAAAGAG